MSLFCPRPSQTSLREKAKSFLTRCRPDPGWVPLTSPPAPSPSLLTLVWPCALQCFPWNVSGNMFSLHDLLLAVPFVWNSLSKTFACVLPHFRWPLPNVPISAMRSLITMFTMAALPNHSLFFPPCFIILPSTYLHLTRYIFYYLLCLLATSLSSPQLQMV